MKNLTKFHSLGSRGLMALLAVPVIIVLAAASCRHTVDPIVVKVDVNVRIDVYQHAVETLDFISGESEALPEVGTETDTETPDTGKLEEVFDWVFGVGTAYAAETPAAQRQQQLLKSMKSRFAKIQQYKTDGSVGENHKGKLSVRDSAKMKSDAGYAGKVKKAVKDENRDREEFYRLNAKLQNTPHAKIVDLYAKLRVKRAKGGEWIEVKKDGKWLWKKK